MVLILQVFFFPITLCHSTLGRLMGPKNLVHSVIHLFNHLPNFSEKDKTSQITLQLNLVSRGNDMIIML